MCGLKDGEYTNKFEDGDKVVLDGEIVTVDRWSYVPKIGQYTYSIIERPTTFFFESELKSIYVTRGQDP